MMAHTLKRSVMSKFTLTERCDWVSIATKLNIYNKLSLIHDNRQ